ncbi:MAG: nucleotidyl transferase AbiEii/AbiGii toxin family protein [Thermoleophilia bacterium]|nr:nucleotidyl transferase AbiEii/AbiGii toxin family protein [Thermoleophilia bacterium]
MLLRDNNDAFAAALEQAEDVAGYPSSIILKDYWVCAVLRELKSQFAGEFQFKGGTSLSKGWGIIDRMSEDVDILVSHVADESIADGERRLQTMTERVCDALEASWSQWRDPGRGRHAHRDDLIAYDARGFSPVGVDASGILLQTGLGGGWEPIELIDVTPLLAQGVAAADAYDDVQVIPHVTALKPVRTLIEKLHLLHTAVTAMSRDGVLADERRIARHYYDIYCCLGHGSTVKALSDRAHMSGLFADVQRISADVYKTDVERPKDGYASSPAFLIDADDKNREPLKKAYIAAEDLMRTGGKWPTFQRVLERVQQHAALL